MSDPADRLLVERIRRGEAEAWRECIDRFEARLVAFVASRLRQRDLAEDVVQETFIGFARALPNFDPQMSLESYLFTIAAHKLTDHLRKTGRRPVVPLPQGLVNDDDSDGNSTSADLPARTRGASSVARGREHEQAQEDLLAVCLTEQIERCRREESFERLEVWELLFVRGLTNRATAEVLHLGEQTVANHKQFLIGKLKDAARTGQALGVLPSE